MNMTAKQRVDEFDARHGRAIYDGHSTIWFEDGAYREPCATGLLAEPPEDDRKYLLNVKRFWELSLAKAVQSFREYKMYITGKTGPNGGFVLDGPIQQEHLDKLQRLKEAVDERKTELAAVEQQLSPPPTAEQVAAEEARLRAASDALGKANAINI